MAGVEPAYRHSSPPAGGGLGVFVFIVVVAASWVIRRSIAAFRTLSTGQFHALYLAIEDENAAF